MQLAEFGQDRSFFALANVRLDANNHRIYISGGNTNEGVTDSVLYFDIARNQLIEQGVASMQYPRHYHSSVALGSKVFVVGGATETDYVEAVEILETD